MPPARRLFRSALLLMLIHALCVVNARAENRVYLFDQSNWGANQGFYLDMENHGSESPLTLSTQTLILGVADGSYWRYITTNPGWQMGVSYKLHAVVGPASASLSLNGGKAQISSGGFDPVSQPANTNLVPNWAADAANFIFVEDSVAVSVNGVKKINYAYQSGQRPAGLAVFLTNPPVRLPLATPAGSTVTIDLVFHFSQAPAPKSYEPLIDAYFQERYASYATKIANDSALKAAASTEKTKLAAWGTPANLDAYGGATKAGWTAKATGYYYIAAHNGASFFIDPLGNPLFYLGMDTVPGGGTGNFTPVTGRTGLFAWLPPNSGLYTATWLNGPWGDGGTTYMDTTASNLIRKYGSTWQTQQTADVMKRLKTLGFSGAAKWSASLPGLPFIPVLGRGAVPNIVAGGHPDIWDASVKSAFSQTLSSQLSGIKNNPYVVCVSMDNEISGIIQPSEVSSILALGAGVPAKQAFCNYALKSLYSGSLSKLDSAWGISAATTAALYAATPNPPASDIESLREYYEDAYYSYVRTTIKQLDPHHLYAGYWIVVGWWVNQSDWTLNAKYCDVVGYDRYAFTYSDSYFAGLVKAANKPILCGEFSFPPHYYGMRGFGAYPTWANDDADAGALYSAWLHDAAADPHCVGCCWFEYRDEAIPGRGPGSGPNIVYGEDYAFGIADGTDQLKWDLVTAMRTSNLAATAAH